MRREDVSRWLERYVAAWKSGERAEIEALFADDARYRYHPYDEALPGRAAIADSWLDDPDEPGSFDASYECFELAAPALPSCRSRGGGTEWRPGSQHVRIARPRFPPKPASAPPAAAGSS